MNKISEICIASIVWWRVSQAFIALRIVSSPREPLHPYKLVRIFVKDVKLWPMQKLVKVMTYPKFAMNTFVLKGLPPQK